jgi:hypothetical protein
MDLIAESSMSRKPAILATSRSKLACSAFGSGFTLRKASRNGAGIMSNSACLNPSKNPGTIPLRLKVAEAKTNLLTSSGWRMPICKHVVPPLLKPRKSARVN